MHFQLLHITTKVKDSRFLVMIAVFMSLNYQELFSGATIYVKFTRVSLQIVIKGPTHTEYATKRIKNLKATKHTLPLKIKFEGLIFSHKLLRCEHLENLRR